MKDRTIRIGGASGFCARASLFWYRGDRFVADVEIPFDISLQRLGVVTQQARSPMVTS